MVARVLLHMSFTLVSWLHSDSSGGVMDMVAEDLVVLVGLQDISVIVVLVRLLS